MAKVINSEQNAQVEDFESWLTQLLPLVYRLCSYLLRTAMLAKKCLILTYLVHSILLC